ncbi:MAG: ABC transporter permease [Acidobacteriia bacterium]|nr:ABC transporter permease [Terriglobia bacterium]
MTRRLQSLLFGLRLLRRSTGFTAVAVITLAIGIGANTAIFSVMYAVLFEPLPYPQPDQLVMVWQKVQGNRNTVSAGDFLDWRRQNTVFEDLNAWAGQDFNLATADRPERIGGGLVTPGLIHMTQHDLFLGRDFTQDEATPGKDHVVIITHRLWERMGADRGILGKPLRLDGEPYTVVGVFKPGTADRLGGQISVPLVIHPEQTGYDAHWLQVMGRLKPGVSIAQAQAEMGVIAQRIAEQHPDTNKGWSASVEPLKNDYLDRGTIQILWLLMGAVGFVLLIACANVANLMLAKGTTRLREVAVRSALGASRAQLFAQFLMESLALALLGGVAGLALGQVLIKVLVTTVPPYSLPAEADVRMSLPVLLFTFAATLVAGVMFGCMPAWQASGVSPNETLKEGGRTGASAGRSRVRRVLVVLESGLALTMLAGAGLAIHSFWNLTRVDLGIRTDHILTFSLPIPPQRFSQSEQMVTFYRQLLEKIKAIPGVSHAEAATGMPVQGPGFGMQFEIVGKPPAVDAGSRPGTGFGMVTPEYFQTFGIRVVKGRSFNEQDRAGAPRVAMVNENFARSYLGNTDPIGQRLRIEELIPGVPRLGPPVEWEIVGVFRVHSGGARNEGFPEVNVPFWQSPWSQASLAVRTSGDPTAMIKSVAAAVNSMEPDLALADVKTMDQLVDESLVGERFVTALYAAFAAVALVLAAVGIYGVMAFAVAQRTHEIGLRMALGAGREQVLRLILKEGVVLALFGLGVGLVGAFFVARILRGLLYGVGTIDFAAFGAVAAILLATALMACYLPARRATQVDPMVALRYE